MKICAVDGVGGDLVQAVIEELAEEGEEAIERRGQPVVRRHVRNEQALRLAKAGLAAGGRLGRGRQVALGDDVV